MYFYIIDPQKTGQKNFERVQNRLYACVAEMRISGEMTRVTTLRSIGQLVESAISRGATTIVGVGHDSTVQDIVNAVGEKDVAIGYVPVEDSELARILGIADVDSACRNLAQRRVETLDLGMIQGGYFFTKVSLGASLEGLQAKSLFDFSKFSEAGSLKPVPVKMEVDGQFSAQFEVAVGAIFNSRAARLDQSRIANPTDGVLDVLLLPGLKSYDAWKYRNELAAGTLEKIPGCAVVHGKRIIISAPEGLPFFVGERTIAKAPAVIEAIPAKIKVIVGRERMF
jgi:diacylglycerol kinase family enzyme